MGLVAIDPFEEQARKAPKPLTTKFVKREPRLTKPLELRKIPQPKRQMVKREMHLTAARMDQVQATASFNTKSVIGNVSTPTVALSLGLVRRISRDVETRGIGSRAIGAVRDALNEFTGIKADYEGYLTFDDSRLMEIPIIFSSGGANESELEALFR